MCAIKLAGMVRKLIAFTFSMLVVFLLSGCVMQGERASGASAEVKTMKSYPIIRPVRVSPDKSTKSGRL